MRRCQLSEGCEEETCRHYFKEHRYISVLFREKRLVFTVRLNWIPKGAGATSGVRREIVHGYGRAKGAEQRSGLHRGREHVPVTEPPIPSPGFTPPGRPAGPQNHQLFYRQHPSAGLRVPKGAELPEPDAGPREREPAGWRQAAAPRQPVPGLELQQRQQLVVALVVHVLVAFVQAELVETGRRGEQRDGQIRRQPVVDYGCERQQRKHRGHLGEPAAAVARLGLLYTVLGPALIW